MNTNYLTEHSLSLFLESNFDGKWIHDKAFIDRKRPDYRNDDLKLIVEFDGYQHYTSSQSIINDLYKTKLYEDNGYKVVRIPYFIQLSSYTIKVLFGVDINFQQTYSHGFIDGKCILPSDFCYLGLKRFKNDILKFSEIENDICKSIIDKINQNCKEIVIPDLIDIDSDNYKFKFSF